MGRFFSGAPVQPLVNFSMAVGEGKTSGKIMGSAWPVNHHRVDHADVETSVINAVLVLIEKNEELGRHGRGHTGQFTVGSPGTVGPVTARTVQPGTPARL